MGLRVDAYKPLVQLALKEAEKHKLYVIVRVQDKYSDKISITNGITQAKRRTQIKGMGIMAFAKDGSSAFASSDILTKEGVTSLISSLAATIKSAKKYKMEKNKEIFKLKPNKGNGVVKTKQDFLALSLEKKEQHLTKLHKKVQAKDKKMSVTSSYAQHDEHWWIARSDGTSVKYSMPYGRIAHTMTKKKGERTQNLFVVLPGIDSTVLTEKSGLALLDSRVKKTYALMCELLDAKSLPAGHYKALLTSGFSGLLAHEAVGHASESDLVRNSVLGKNGKLRKGELLSPKNISFVDGPVPGMWGDIRFSDNGVQRQTVEFIKEGKLVSSLSDVYTAKTVGAQINGCGRSEYFHDITIPRMSNTRIVDKSPIKKKVDADKTSLNELYKILDEENMFADGSKVVMPVRPMGGEVTPEAGTFMFNCAGIYVFEKPKKITLYGAAAFGGDILGAIKTPMRGIGEQLNLTDVGMCGKSSQGAPVTDGSHPFLLLDKTEAITFGGE